MAKFAEHAVLQISCFAKDRSIDISLPPLYSCFRSTVKAKVYYLPEQERCPKLTFKEFRMISTL